jgi:hypothetical protein
VFLRNPEFYSIILSFNSHIILAGRSVAIKNFINTRTLLDYKMPLGEAIRGRQADFVSEIKSGMKKGKTEEEIADYLHISGYGEKKTLIYPLG